MIDSRNREAISSTTIVHIGGTRKTYRSHRSGLYVYLHIPLGEHLVFSVNTGECTKWKRMAEWKLDETDRVKLELEYRKDHAKRRHKAYIR